MIRLGLLLLAVALANEACSPFRDRRQYPFVESGVVRNGFRGHGAKYNDTIGFSPDAKAVAYLWSEGRYGPPLPADERPRPRTLQESIHLRSFEIGAPLAEISVLLESADLGAQGEPGFNLEASVFFSPDSRYLAAVSPGQLIVVDRVSGSRRSLGPPGAHFGAFRWRSPRQLAYSTHADGQLNFRVVDLDGPDAVGRSVFREEGWVVPSRDRLAFNAWSPSGRHVILGSVIVDLDTGGKRPSRLLKKT